jgi:hypothetical protein
MSKISESLKFWDSGLRTPTTQKQGLRTSDSGLRLHIPDCVRESANEKFRIPWIVSFCPFFRLFFFIPEFLSRDFSSIAKLKKKRKKKIRIFLSLVHGYSLFVWVFLFVFIPFSQFSRVVLWIIRVRRYYESSFSFKLVFRLYGNLRMFDFIVSSVSF